MSLLNVRMNLCVLVCVGLLQAAAVAGQTSSANAPITANAPAIPTFPESASGLEHLIKDIWKAQKSGDGTYAQKLIDSMVLPDYQAWYRELFDDEMAEAGIASYKSAFNSLPAQLARFFVGVQQGQTSVSVVKFDETCDDNASEHTFGILLSRTHSVPLYEARFIKDGKFSRLFAFVYAGGGFRFALLPDPEKVAPHWSPPASNLTEKTAQAEELHATRLKQGGPVTAAKLLQKVSPEYPEVARRERIQGTIRLHALIGSDGRIHGLRVMSGACSLAKAAYDAVSKWRYSPTTFNGIPVEVDTTIDVFFQLRQ